MEIPPGEKILLIGDTRTALIKNNNTLLYNDSILSNIGFVLQKDFDQVKECLNKKINKIHSVFRTY